MISKTTDESKRQKTTYDSKRQTTNDEPYQEDSIIDRSAKKSPAEQRIPE